MVNGVLPHYLRMLSRRCAPVVDPELMSSSVLLGAHAVAHSNGSRTNLETFYEAFYANVHVDREILNPLFDVFYKEDYPNLAQFTRQKPEARSVVQHVLDLGLEVVIATNPHFPHTAIQQRLAWAGVEDLPYSRITTLENSHYAKPHPGYYLEILQALDCTPRQALMVGNETMDMAAADVGCLTYFIDNGQGEMLADKYQADFTGTLVGVVAVLDNLTGNLLVN